MQQRKPSGALICHSTLYPLGMGSSLNLKLKDTVCPSVCPLHPHAQCWSNIPSRYIWPITWHWGSKIRSFCLCRSILTHGTISPTSVFTFKQSFFLNELSVANWLLIYLLTCSMDKLRPLFQCCCPHVYDLHYPLDGSLHLSPCFLGPAL